jgi:hypothetical protein
MVISSFVAARSATLAIDQSVTVRVNNAVRFERPIFINKNEVVSAQLTSPSGWSSTRRIAYSLNGDPLSFTVANENRSSVNFTLQGLANRWYRYDIDDNHFVSYYNYGDETKIRELGFNDVPFAVDIGTDIKDFSANNFLIKSPTGLKKKRPQDAGNHYEEIVFENDYLTIDESEEFSLGESDFTIDIRVKPFNFNDKDRYIVGTLTKSPTGGLGGWAIHLKNEKIHFTVDDSIEIIAEDNLTLNEWNHVAITRNLISTNIWINGRLSKSGSSTYNDNFVGSMKIATVEDQNLFPAIGNKKYNFMGALSCFRVIKQESVYKSNFEVPEPVLSLTANTVLLTIQEDPGTIRLINVIPDPKTKTVYFYNQFGHLLDNIRLPSEPCQVEKFISEDGGYFIVSCRNKRLYKITLDKRVINKDYLLSNDGKILEWIFQLPFETDVAFVGSFTTFAKIKNKQINIGQPNSLSMSNGKTWVGGYNKIWQIDKYFKILQDFDVVGTIMGLTSLGDKCAATIKSDTSGNLDLTIFDSSGLSGSIHNAKWLSEPLVFNGHIYVSDSSKRSIVKVNPDTLTKEIIDLGNNTPSYLSSNSNSIFIACHDSNRVLIYSGSGAPIREVYFPEKVTWVSALESSFMVSHYLKDVQVMAHDRPSIIYDPSKTITCEKSMAAIQPFKVKNLGVSSYAISSGSATHWVDGVPNATIKHGCYLSISKQLDRIGYHQENIVIGDTVVDYKAYVEDGDFYPKSVSIDPINVSSSSDVVEISFQYKHDFIDSFNAAYRSNAYASVNYGFLKKNFSVYTGETKIQDGDIVTVCVPFGLSVPNMVVTLTIGSREFLVPINNAVALTEIKSFLDVERTSKINHSFVINRSGKYFFPYFTNAVSKNLRLKDVDFKSYDVVNLGGNFDGDYPLSNLVDENEAFVRAEDGLFDVYIDVNYPIIASGLDVLIKYDYDTLQIVDDKNPIDEEGNPNFIELKIFRKTPVNFNVLASNDGLNWTIIEEFRDVPNGFYDWIPGEFKSFQLTSQQKYRYWRLQNTTTQGLGVSVNGIKLRAKFPSFFSVTRNGTQISPGFSNLNEGDEVSIEISSNDRLYDAIRYFIVGPDNYELCVKNKSNPTLSHTIFDEINQPSLREEYISESIIISSESAKPISLYSFDPLLLMSKNGGAFSQSLQVQTNDSLRLKKVIRNVFDSSSSVYDRQEDAENGEIIDVDVIKINVNNIVLTGPADNSKNNFLSGVHSRVANRIELVRSSSSYGVVSNLFKPIRPDYIFGSAINQLNPIASINRFNAIENFINDFAFSSGFESKVDRVDFKLSTEFNKVASVANFLIFKDPPDFTNSEIKYIKIDSLEKEINVNAARIVNPFEYERLIENYTGVDPFTTIKNKLNFVTIEKFISNASLSNLNLIPHLFNFVKKQSTFLSILTGDYVEELKTYLRIIPFEYDNALNNPAGVVNSFLFEQTLQQPIVSSKFNFIKFVNNALNASAHAYRDDHETFLTGDRYRYIESFVNEIIISGYDFHFNRLKEYKAAGYSVIPPAPGNLLYIVSYDLEINKVKAESLTAFPFKRNAFNLLKQRLVYDVNSIKLLKVQNYLDNLTAIKVNYLFVQMDYEASDRFLYTFRENGFYGFFDSESDAANEAIRKKHAPFKVYNIPETNKWTYRREYQFIDGCSIADGRIKRLVQGG